MNRNLKILFSEIPAGRISGEQLERAVITQFNEHLDLFPPGYSPAEAIDDGVREHVIELSGGKFRIIGLKK